MTVTSGFYTPGQSWLYRLDPRVRLWFGLLGLILCLIATRLDVLAGLLLISHLILLLGGLPIRRLAGVWQALAPLILIVLIGQPLLTPGLSPALWELGPLRVTQAGLSRGLLYAVRVAAAAFVALVPVLTTPINRLVLALQKVGLPYRWGMMIGLALRYLGTIQGLYMTIFEAQQARGWDVSQSGPLRRAQAALPTLIALIIASLRLGDALALGLAARGFGLQQKRSAWQELTMRSLDWLALALITLGFGVGVWLAF